MDALSEHPIVLVAGAGEHWDTLVKTTILKGLYGIENLSGIPGTVGGTPIQNVGAYGVEVKDSIEWVEIFDPQTMRTRKLKNNECQFSYRNSIFKSKKGRNLIVVRVCFCLSKNKKYTLTYRDVP